MTLQRLLSVTLSIGITVPVYFLCKKFVKREFAIIGAALIAFEPRLMINSFLGITDPLYFLLIVSSLTVFLYANKKWVYFSFILVAFATLVRGEGIVFFVVLSILFFIKFRNEKYKIILKYILITSIFVLVILPLSVYKYDITENDGVFLRSINSAEQLFSTKEVSTDNENKIFSGFEIFIKYFIWIMIPNFIIFLPLGILLIFKKRTIENLSIILSIGMMSIPAFYAYVLPALDTRYLYVLLPMFSVLAVITIQRIIGKNSKSNIFVISIIVLIIISSVLFYDYKKIDYEHERESFEIMGKISNITNGINVLNPETSYISSVQTIKQWPTLYSEINFELILIPTDNYNSMKEFILNSEDKGLTHVIVDGNFEREGFLKESFIDETKYSYLKKVYDSKDDNFVYHVKVFEIDYKSLNNEK
ncbi:hypothetical protein [Nitrosopumilus cobalaminigenes]|nr:hypothetical protein [Nitrosopumilus cobalaminigenes]